MSGQKILDPADQHTTGQWSPSGPIPPPLRQFGRFPNVRDWFPGDLLLFSAVHPNWISKSIIRGQENGGYAAEDARWHHVAVYLGDGISICEATSTGVHHAPIYPYLGEYLLRVRRDPTLTPDQRWQIAIKSLTRLGSRYSFRHILSLAYHSWHGFWRQNNSLPPLGAKAVICSQLFSEAYTLVTSRLPLSSPSGPMKPADLSLTESLTDIETSWLKI